MVAFLDTEKYPPSLQFLLMTLGPTLIALAKLERFNGGRLRGFGREVLAFGRVPMFYYVLHLYLIHLLALVIARLCGQPFAWLGWNPADGSPGPGYGHGLVFVYAVFGWTILLLYWPCRWFAELKKGRKDWWLRYV